MKRWIKILGFAVGIVGVSLGASYYMGLQYKIPAYVAHTVQSNMELSNFERELSVSLSFDNPEEVTNINSPFKKIDDSVFVIHEAKANQDSSVSYQLSSQGEEFIGSEITINNHLTVKSPMYHRFITFDKSNSVVEKEKASHMHQSFTSFVKNIVSSSKLYRDIGGNEEGVKTLMVKNENEVVYQLLNSLINGMNEGVPYQSILLNNEKITNRLLKEHKTEEEVKEVFYSKSASTQEQIRSFLTQSTITESEVSIKITNERIIKEWNSTIKMIYTQPETNKKIAFTLYADLNTWNVHKTVVEEIQTDFTNAIPYEQMADNINYFEDENLQKEVNAEEDVGHTQQGYEEYTTTLEELGEFTPVLPDKEKKSEKQ